MSERVKRPWEIVFLGVLFMVVGAVGLVYHGWRESLDRWLPVTLLVRLAAVVGGVFLILGRNWARWLLLAWLALHVVVSAFHSAGEAAAHAVLLVVIGYFLLGTRATEYFRGAAG